MSMIGGQTEAHQRIPCTSTPRRAGTRSRIDEKEALPAAAAVVSHSEALPQRGGRLYPQGGWVGQKRERSRAEVPKGTSTPASPERAVAWLPLISRRDFYRLLKLSTDLACC